MSKYNTVDEIMVKLDDIRFDDSYGGQLYTYMDGYQPASLIELYTRGRLKIHSLPPMALTIMYGCAIPKQGKHGDIHSVDIYIPGYLPIVSKYFLIHEMLHAQGWAHSYQLLDYSDEQKEIMEKEGIKKWTETSFYKNEIDTYHQ